MQPLRRRAGSRSAAAGLALGGAGLALCIASVSLSSWLVLLPAGSLLGMAYGLCLAGGLTEVEALADPQTRGALTATFYALTYVGMGAPFAVTELSRAVGATATFSAACSRAPSRSGGSDGRRRWRPSPPGCSSRVRST